MTHTALGGQLNERSVAAPESGPSQGGMAHGCTALRKRALWLLERLPIFAGLLIFAKYRSGVDSIVRQHDNLDYFQAVFAQVGLGDLFSAPGTKIPYLLGGLDRGFLGSEFHLGHLSSALLPLMAGLLLNEIAMRALAFYSMRRLFVSIGLGSERLAVYVTATLFSLLPFYPPSFGGVAAFPLLVSVFVDVARRRSVSRRDYVLACAFPLYAAPYMTIPMLLLFCSAAAVLYIGLDRASALSVFRLSAALGAAVVLIDWRLIAISVFGNGSHRADMISPQSLDSARWEGAAGMILSEVPHVAIGKTTLLGVVVLTGLVLLGARVVTLDRVQEVFVAACTGAIVFGLVVTRLWPWFEAEVITAVFPEWGRFLMNRIRWTEATTVVSLFGIGLVSIRRSLAAHGRAFAAAASALVVAAGAIQGVHTFGMQEFRALPDSLTVRQFYAPNSMGQIAKAFDADSGKRIVSVGLHPAVAIYNGIPSADGYWTAYDINYKERFRRLIAPALEVNDEDRRYFDNWGSRAYVFPGEGRRPSCCSVPRHDPLELRVDPSEFEPLGITHLLSSSVILNASELGLKIEKQVDDDAELGLLVLYRVATPVAQ